MRIVAGLPLRLSVSFVVICAGFMLACCDRHGPEVQFTCFNSDGSVRSREMVCSAYPDVADGVWSVHYPDESGLCNIKQRKNYTAMDCNSHWIGPRTGARNVERER